MGIKGVEMDSITSGKRRGEADWGKRAQRGFLASGIDPADRRGRKNLYIDLLQKMALEEVLELRGDEAVLDFGCGSGRIAYWIAPRVKKVVGLEITPEMIELAEKNRESRNVEFRLYDGTDFPVFPYPFDLVLSVGVLQDLKGEQLGITVSKLTRALKSGGRLCVIEQASDDPGAGRPTVRDYLRVFQESNLNCFRYDSIRRGRWWMLYLIRYGLIPKKWFPRIALWELKKGKGEGKKISYYQDWLFVVEKP
jgi:SAM-dependent methyltransferase